MIVGNRGSVLGLLQWQWKHALLFLAAAAAIVAARHYLGWHWLKMPQTPANVIGAALGIFVAFRTNSCYDRWWEGRKLWGRMINSSRHFCTQVIAYVSDEGLRAALVHRHIAYVHALRAMLRGQDPWADPEALASFSRFDGGQEELEELRGQSNLTHALLHLQQRSLAELGERGALTELRLQSLDRTIAALLDIQGGCERIKKTPFPKGYGFIADRLIWAYSFIFPLVIAENLGWAAVPINLLVCMALALISEVGRVLEDPFSLFWNGLPLSAISRMIEVNLRERLGEREGVPPLLKPNARGILM